MIHALCMNLNSSGLQPQLLTAATANPICTLNLKTPMQFVYFGLMKEAFKQKSGVMPESVDSLPNILSNVCLTKSRLATREAVRRRNRPAYALVY